MSDMNLKLKMKGQPDIFDSLTYIIVAVLDQESNPLPTDIVLASGLMEPIPCLADIAQ